MNSISYFYKVEAVNGAQVFLTVAEIRSRQPFPPTPRGVLGGLLTGWRMLFTGLGYRDLPLTNSQAHALYLSAPSFERMATLYANYCPHNETISAANYFRARDRDTATVSSLSRRGIEGMRQWVSLTTAQNTYGIMTPGHIYNHKAEIRDETDTLLLDFKPTLLGGAGHPAASLSFRAGAPSLIHFLRPGMVWEFSDEYECPHCLTNAAYTKIEPTHNTDLLIPGEPPTQRSQATAHICQCSLCGGRWREELSITGAPAQEADHPSD